jgi:hypothetical protein
VFSRSDGDGATTLHRINVAVVARKDEEPSERTRVRRNRRLIEFPKPGKKENSTSRAD